MTNPIFDIAPLTEAVTIGDKQHHVVGVPMRVLMQAAKENPEVMALLFGGKLDGAALFNKAPDLFATFIAWGFRGGEDPAVLKAASDYPMDTQIALFKGVLKRTLLGGAGPFVAEMQEFRKMIELEDEKKEESRIFRLKAAQPKTTPTPSDSSTPTSDSVMPKFGT